MWLLFVLPFIFLIMAFSAWRMKQNDLIIPWLTMLSLTFGSIAIIAEMAATSTGYVTRAEEVSLNAKDQLSTILAFEKVTADLRAVTANLNQEIQSIQAEK